MSSMPSGRSRLTLTQWLIVSLASIGFAFDIYELLMMQFIVKDLITELTGYTPTDSEFRTWGAVLFYVPAVAGGIFGLLGGYLTDRLGRRRVLTWSILIYAFSAFAAGFSTSIEMLLVLRCLTFVGVCVEFVAAVAWLAELFPDPRQRESVLGYTQAFSSLGGFLVAGAYWIAARYAADWPAVQIPEFLSFMGEIQNGNAPWRYTLMSGLIPALPLIVIRPFLPESPVWEQRRASGALQRPSFLALFSPELRRTTIATTIVFACAYGAAFGAIQQIRQIVPGVLDVSEAIAEMPLAEQKQYEKETSAFVGEVQETGGLTGRILLAILAVRIVSRRRLLRVFQLPGLIIVPAVFVFAPSHSLNALTIGAFLAGLFTVGQFSFLGNYLPRVYPLHLRGTGEGFAANVGGRMIGTSFAAVTLLLSNYMPAETPPMQIAYAAACVSFFVYFVGSVACFFLPEPEHEELPE
ncbi:MAG: MFS transporter [Planctomycetota bacterium]|nr:MAG: MFS transporter [Planctomycetota bacterium]